MRDAILNWIERTLRSGNPPAFSLEGSYEHPNGFVKIVLPSVLAEYTECRVHFWSVRHEDSDIHDHTSNFKSLVMFGCIEESRWQLDNNGDRFPLFKCKSRQNDEVKLDLVGYTGISLISKSCFRSGDEYLINHSTLHSIRVLGKKPVITFLGQSSRKSKTTRVIKRLCGEPTIVQSAISMDPSKLLLQLAKVRDLIDSPD